MNTKRIISTILIAFAGGLIAVSVYAWIFNVKTGIISNQENIPVKYVNYGSGSPTNTDLTVAAEKSIQTVVHVKTQYTEEYYNPYEFFFGGGGRTQVPVQTSGSGVIITNDGYIVTNNHVIDNSEYIEVILNDKRTYQAKLIATDPSTDIALIKIDEKDLPFISYGNSDNVKIGEWVLAVGNPFNLTSTVTAGIISAKARNINILSEEYSIESFIQTDAAVNPGNSGGALVNTDGDLIGVITAIASGTGNYVGYSFAIPVNIVKKIVADLMEYGEVQRAYLGLVIVNLDSKIAAQLGIDETQGVYVRAVNEGSAGKEAGILEGDLVVSINDYAIHNVPELNEQLSKYRPGDKINLSVKRKGEIINAVLTLKNKNGDTRIVKTEAVISLGANLEEVTSDEKHSLGLDNGVKIKKLNTGVLKNQGLRDGFIITAINRKLMNTPDQVKEVLDKAKGNIYIEGVYPNGMYAYFSFKL